MLRDKRTIRSMIIIPTLVMPGLAFGVGTIATKIFSKARAEVSVVAVTGGTDSPGVVAALREEPKLRVIEAPSDWNQQVVDKRLRAVVQLPPHFEAELASAVHAPVTISYYEGELKSGFAASELESFFRKLRERTVKARLAERGLTPELVEPFETKRQNVAPPEKVGGNAVGGIVPYFIIILCFTGAMYPAMDLTAGEKERGTMETLLCSPVARRDLVLGKFLMVLTSSLAAMVLSTTSMIVSFTIIGPLLGRSARASAGGEPAFASIDPAGVLGVIGMVLPVAILFSALLFAVSLFAKSFKEAQSYVGPMVIVIILPAVVGMLPGIDLNARLALVPILNLSLACREMLSGVWHWGYLAIIFGSTSLYAFIALAWAVRMFNREDVIFRT